MKKTKRTKANPPAPAAKLPHRRLLYILSDSTGNLARHMLTAFLTQFPPSAFDVRARTFLQSPAKLNDALNEVEREPGMVFHAVVLRDFKKLINLRCNEIGVSCCDLTGNFIEFLAHESGIEPSEDHRRLHDVDEAYERRIEAIEFAMQHDDGLGLETLHEADLVLAGISRTSKTPTSIYLAQQGYKAANVSLAMGIEPPKELTQMLPKKVVGLVIDPARLTEIRTRRQQAWRMGRTDYNDDEAVEREIAWSRQIFTRRGWHVLDVTEQAIEETAARVLHVLGVPHSSDR
jgi:hypothetical protein